MNHSNIMLRLHEVEAELPKLINERDQDGWDLFYADDQNNIYFKQKGFLIKNQKWIYVGVLLYLILGIMFAIAI